MDRAVADLTESFKKLCAEAVQSAQTDCARVMADDAKRSLDERTLEKSEQAYYSIAANTTGRMAQLAAAATPPVWDALERALGELRDALSEDLSRFFRDEAFMEEASARREAERGTFDPTYLVYSVGKLMLLKLRQDCKLQQGKAFSLRGFHDTLLANGTAPFWLHRQLLLGEDGADLLE